MKNLLLLAVMVIAVVGLAITMSRPHLHTTTAKTKATASLDHITGSPTMSVEAMDHVLAVAGSPAHGFGHTLWQLGTQYHINPAYALAFFHHESSYGTAGMATLTHSLGNIRCTAGYACDPTGGYRWYATWADGATDWFKLMHDVYLPQGRDTIATIIPIYAPAADHNNETAYIEAVRADVQRWQQGQV